MRFGARAATKVHVVSATKLTCRAPRGVGVVNVRVVTKAGKSAARKADHFAYQGGPPAVTGVSPAYGPASGGTAVTITGSGFTGATAVTFGLGGKAATTFTVVSDNSITATAPAQSPALDPYDVTVTTPLGTSPALTADRFSYYAAPTITSVSPVNGPQQGGTAVTIQGNNLYTARSISGSVSFGGVAATVDWSKSSNTTIKATAPAGTGTVDVTVTTYGGTSATVSADRFSYAATVAAAPGSELDQSQVVGAAVGTPPSVEVTDGLGNPVAGVVVAFAVQTGGGTVGPATVTTDVSGIATATSWSLGTSAGIDNDSVTATVAGLSGSPVTFTASALAGNADQIAGVSGGDGQTANAGTAVHTAPSVLVTDADGNPVAGVSVSFAASGNGDVGNDTALTDTAGVASVGSWTLATTPGSNTLKATATGLVGSPVTFTAEGTVGPAAQIAADSATDQSGTAGLPVGVPPSVVVEDANGNPVPGVSVTFTVTSGGGSVGGTPVPTSSSGVATVGTWTLGPAAGSNTLEAVADGVSASVTFTATATLTVTAVDAIADISVVNGTPLSSVSLPTSVGVSLNNGDSATAQVSWDGGTPTYDASTAGTYVFAGTLSGLSGGATNPSHLSASVKVIVGAPTVTAVDAIADISVVNGTPLSSVSLPTSVGVSLNNGDSATAQVSWDGGTPTYDASTAGTYVFAGTLSGLSGGATNPSHLSASVKVIVGAPTVTAVDAIADISVVNGTPLSSVSLPTSVGVSLNNGDSATAQVSWDGGTPTYDASTAGTYVFAGTLSGLSGGATNPSQLTATVNVIVQP